MEGYISSVSLTVNHSCSVVSVTAVTDKCVFTLTKQTLTTAYLYRWNFAVRLMLCLRGLRGMAIQRITLLSQTCQTRQTLQHAPELSLFTSRPSPSSNGYNLRVCGHPYNLPDCSTNVHKNHLLSVLSMVSYNFYLLLFRSVSTPIFF